MAPILQSSEPHGPADQRAAVAALLELKRGDPGVTPAVIGTEPALTEESEYARLFAELLPYGAGIIDKEEDAYPLRRVLPRVDAKREMRRWRMLARKRMRWRTYASAVVCCSLHCIKRLRASRELPTPVILGYCTFIST